MAKIYLKYYWSSKPIPNCHKWRVLFLEQCLSLFQQRMPVISCSAKLGGTWGLEFVLTQQFVFCEKSWFQISKFACGERHEGGPS